MDIRGKVAPFAIGVRLFAVNQITAGMGDARSRTEPKIAEAQELRRQAALARHAASVPTSGSGRVDRVLVLLAEQLERDAGRTTIFETPPSN
jgi:hypothetical protein